MPISKKNSGSIKKIIKNYPIGYTMTEYNKLVDYLNIYNKCQNVFINEQWCRFDFIFNKYEHYSRDYIINKINQAKDAIKENPNYTPSNHIVNYLLNKKRTIWSHALVDSILTLQKLQIKQLNIIVANVNNNNNLTIDEKNYIIAQLNYNRHNLNDIFHNKKIQIPDDINDHLSKYNIKDYNKLHNLIQRLLKKYCIKKPFANGNSYILDAYDLNQIEEKNQLYVKLPTTKMRKVIKLKLSNSQKFVGYIRVVLRHGKIELHRAIDIKVIKNKHKKKTITIDTGLEAGLFCVNDGVNNFVYGDKIIQVLRKYTKYIHEKNNKRNQFEKKSKTTKIIKNNLGTKTISKKKYKLLLSIKQYINQTINELINNQMPTDIKLTKNSYTFLKLHKDKLHGLCNNELIILGNIINSHIKKTIDFKSKKNGINLTRIS